MRDKRRVNKTVVKKIIEYCDKIEILIQRFGNSLKAFEADFAFQMSCGMCIIQIGELTTRLTENFKENHSDIAWNEIKGLRNIHAHDYENIDLEELWKILTEDVPELKVQLQKVFKNENNFD